MRLEERVIGGSQIERRTLVAAVVAPVGGVSAVAVTAALWGRLPDPMAIHWSMAGRPDGSLVRGAGVALLLGVAVVAGLSSCALVLLGVRGAGLLAGAGAMFSWVAWCAVVANHGAATWEAAGRLPLVVAVAGVAGATAVAVAVERGVVAPAYGTRRARGDWVAAAAALALLVLLVVDARVATVALVALAAGLAVRWPVRATVDDGGFPARPREPQHSSP